MMPYTDYTVRLGDLKRAIMKNPYDPNLDIDGYMRYLKYNTPSAQPERLTDDDFEAIRIHLNAFKENLCNQGRWKEAEDYERLIDRFMSFASAQTERKKGRWLQTHRGERGFSRPGFRCDQCGEVNPRSSYCPSCGARMEESDG